MNIQEFQKIITEGKSLEGAEMIEFMREQSDESRRIQFELNCHYHTPASGFPALGTLKFCACVIVIW